MDCTWGVYTRCFNVHVQVGKSFAPPRPSIAHSSSPPRPLSFGAKVLTKLALPKVLTKLALPKVLTKLALPKVLTKLALPKVLTKLALP